GGSVLGGAFFLLLFFAALTSAISMMECSVSWLQDRFDWARNKAALVSGGLSWCLGLLSVFSFNLLADVHPLGNLRLFAGKTFFDLFDYICSTLFMPLSGVLVALLAGWAL